MEIEDKIKNIEDAKNLVIARETIAKKYKKLLTGEQEVVKTNLGFKDGSSVVITKRTAGSSIRVTESVKNMIKLLDKLAEVYVLTVKNIIENGLKELDQEIIDSEI